MIQLDREGGFSWTERGGGGIQLDRGGGGGIQLGRVRGYSAGQRKVGY